MRLKSDPASCWDELEGTGTLLDAFSSRWLWASALIMPLHVLMGRVTHDRQAWSGRTSDPDDLQPPSAVSLLHSAEAAIAP